MIRACLVRPACRQLPALCRRTAGQPPAIGSPGQGLRPVARRRRLTCASPMPNRGSPAAGRPRPRRSTPPMARTLHPPPPHGRSPRAQAGNFVSVLARPAVPAWRWRPLLLPLERRDEVLADDVFWVVAHRQLPTTRDE